MQISLVSSSCLANMMGIKTTLNTFGDELSYHRRGLCVSESVHVTNGGSGGMMSTAGLVFPYPRVFKAEFWNETSRREM